MNKILIASVTAITAGLACTALHYAITKSSEFECQANIESRIQNSDKVLSVDDLKKIVAEEAVKTKKKQSTKIIATDVTIDVTTSVVTGLVDGFRI